MTQESCFHGGSSGLERVTEIEGEVGMLEKSVSLSLGVSCTSPHGAWGAVGVGMNSSIRPPAALPGELSGSGILRPFTPQASTGRTTVFLTCILSLGHNRFAFRKTLGLQLYFIMTPARVSAGFTLCT